ncbi:hypothetical protein [Streptomyces sp. CAU 1734]|uniref:hypothetical protein n=1 Tax=Streptomyces sp. CAU 1734 TaxID=3140360 RepID=UPI003260EA94
MARAGGYWWDGSRWYRPAQLWDEAADAFEQQPVPAASTVTAADLIDDPRADPDRGLLHQVSDLPGPSTPGDGPQWLHDLARWAARRPAGPPSERCVVTVAAPELAGDRLIGTPGLAQAAAISPSALRAYISRGQGEVPEPQAIVTGRPMWSRPVAENWASHRSRPAAARWPSRRRRPLLLPDAKRTRDHLGPSCSPGCGRTPRGVHAGPFGTAHGRPSRKSPTTSPTWLRTGCPALRPPLSSRRSSRRRPSPAS